MWNSNLQNISVIYQIQIFFWFILGVNTVTVIYDKNVSYRNVVMNVSNLSFRLKDIDHATNAKFALEQKQRDEAKDRKERGLKWETLVINFE